MICSSKLENWSWFVSELALVTHKPRAASVYAVGPTKCAGKFRFQVQEENGLEEKKHHISFNNIPIIDNSRLNRFEQKKKKTLI